MVHGAVVTPARPARSLLLGALLGVAAAPSCGPRRADVMMSEGIAAQRDGDLSAAEARYEAALRVDPRVVGAANNLALVALARGQDDAAILRIKDELDRHPDLGEARLNQAWLLVRGGRYQKVDEALVELSDLGAALPPDTPRVRRRRATARALLAVARYARAAPWGDVRAARERPLAELLPGDALTEPDRALDALTREVLGLAALRVGANAEALELLDGLDAPRATRARAAALIAAGRTAEADAALASLSEAAPFDRLARAWIALNDGRHGVAAQALAQLATPPEGAEATWHRLQAALASRRGDWATALAHVDAAIALPGDTPPDLWLDRATALAHLGRLDDARVTVIGVLRDRPDDARARGLSEALGE